MLLNVLRTGGEYDLEYHEMTAVFWLGVPPLGEVNDGSDTVVVGSIEVEEVLRYGPNEAVEAVRIDGRKYMLAGINPLANKVVLDDESGTQLAIGF